MKLKYTTIAFVGAMILGSCSSEGHKTRKPYAASWESLKQHETPKWFLDAKFGIYAHWGPYSVPRFRNEWYSHWMYVHEGNPEYPYQKEIYEHHINTYGTLDSFGYKDFIPMFTASKFNADEWAELFEKAGAKFAGTVSEHADGFAMWDSKLTKWDAMDMGPKRDIMGELSVAIRARGMKYVATYHRHWLYAWFPTWDTTTDASKSEYSGLYGPKVNKGDFIYPRANNVPADSNRYYPLPDAAFIQEWYSRLIEIVDKYRPDLVWFDNKMDIIDEQYRKQFLSYYYNRAAQNNQQVLVTYKFNDLDSGTAVVDVERSRMSTAKKYPWLTDDSIDWNSWCDIENPNYKSVNRLIDVFLDIISKNGCLLLNITPHADGSIPEGVKERLIEMGKWLQTNGEAVYGSRPWKVYGEGPTQVVEGHLSEELNDGNTSEDIRFTQKDHTIYAFMLDWPGDIAQIKSMGKNAGLLSGQIQSVQLLGSKTKLSWKQYDDHLLVNMPKKTGDYAFTIKIEVF